MMKYQNCLIRLATIKDAKQLCDWWNDGAIMAHAGWPLGAKTTIDEVIERITKSPSTRYVIEYDSLVIGEMSARKVDETTAEVGIKICDSDYLDKGLGKIYLSLLFQHLFDEQGCEAIILDTNVKNLRAQATYKKLGFKEVSDQYRSWPDQLGVMQYSIDYRLIKSDFNSFAKNL